MEDLQQQGVRVFCDEAIDLSDRQVKARVQQALMKSRCVVVHVPSNCKGSGWCRAEYGSALRCSEEGKVQRVVVARRTLDAPVPASLVAVPVFDLPDAVYSLSEFLVESNRIPAEIEAEVEAQRTGSYGTPLGTRQDLMERSTRMLEILSALRVSVEREEAVSSEVLQRVVGRARYFQADRGPRVDLNNANGYGGAAQE